VKNHASQHQNPDSGKTAPDGIRDRFRELSRKTAEAVGSIWAFLIALLTVIVWALTGPIFGFSDTWQLVINTGTTIVTFIMVFLIQSTQNRDAKAVHLKLDELIRAVGPARNALVELEDLPEEELQALAEQFDALRKRASSQIKRTQSAPEESR
jgi:low affinity Fe/Cu permease